ncbi:conserved hypothetical protein [Neorickettsia risticii str. Illinois]|uniref:Uncharacterized protein n=1 Tax=Neorickettsia risticii (strain Illinois) TaxID=434131 RepID=C6V5L3_NEORI|nr:hypothetical protein [Neorickettsia risticii]ACT69687.1 conserved hypothetical protein [Neorickettsia risticii str. Illinois]
MFRVICVVFLLSFFSLPSYSIEVKTAAMVGDVIISNQDVHNYQNLVVMLGEKSDLSYSAALEQMIDLEVCYQYAKRVGLPFSDQKYDAALKHLQALGINRGAHVGLLEEYLKKQVFLSEVVDQIIRPRVRIDDSDFDAIKRELLKKKNTFKLKRINSNGSTEELGWLGLDGLQPNIRDAVSRLAVGKVSEEVDGSRFQVLDKENDFVLSVEYKGLVSPKSDVVGMYQTLYSGKLSELKAKDRKDLFLMEHDIEVRRDERIILNLALDSDHLRGQLIKFIYSKKITEALKELSLKLRENIHVVKYTSK